VVAQHLVAHLLAERAGVAGAPQTDRPHDQAPLAPPDAMHVDLTANTQLERAWPNHLCRLRLPPASPDRQQSLPPAISVLRFVRVAGDTKTRKSCRRSALPRRCVDALTAHQTRLGRTPNPSAPVFATANGTELDPHNVRRAFRAIVHTAGLDAKAWTPRELRHSFVSILSDSGAPIEQIARLLGHSGTAVTDRVYRHQLWPVLEEGAATMDSLFPSDDAG
jgi:hypothetical protein